MVKRRFHSSVNIAKTRSFSGADIGSNYNLALMTFSRRLKTCRKQGNTRIKFNFQRLKDPTILKCFQANIGEKFAPPLVLNQDDTEVNSLTNTFNTTMTETANEPLGKHRVKKMLWVTDDIFDLCDKRRALKNKNNEPEGAKEYRYMNLQVKKRMRGARLKWIEEHSEEVEDSLDQNNSKKAYQIIKDLTSTKQGRTTSIQSKEGKYLTEEQEVQTRSTEYCSELYTHKTTGDPRVLNVSQSKDSDKSSILSEKIVAAVSSLKKGKSAGIDNITAEIVQAAFDRVWQEALWATMNLYNINANLIKVIEKLYSKATGAVFTNSNIGAWFRTIVGVRQGCQLSPTLFNIFLERIMTDALEDHEGTISVGSRTPNNSRFADGIGGLARQEQGLVSLVDRLEKTTTYSMEISAEKTKRVFNNSKNITVNIQVNNQRLETVRSFKYLDAIVTDEGSKLEIISRIAETSAALTKLKTIWNDRNITIRPKIRLMRVLVM
ncbi:uncharacterized protein LOC106014226 [Aplysia californica]|uniref:Uncharacterized protein LOC106014226 n=1 Tax=Aplysia californica TaxID=6500 RepID=A0ABM1AG25_APLCA|nr:uncharacterized protein LOC106014226 [Aplysia californica]